MWCPKCKTEYRDGIMVCVDCGTPLESGREEDFDVVEICSLKDEEMAEKFLEYLHYSGITGAKKKYDDATSIYTVTVPTGLEKKAGKFFEGFMLAVEEANEQKDDANEETTFEEMLENSEPSETEYESDSQEYDWDAEDDSAKSDPFESNEAAELMMDDEIEKTPKEILYSPAKEYIKKEDEYKDLQFSGLTFIFFGIAGMVYLLLCKLEVIPIQYHLFIFIAILIMFGAFLALGISSIVKATKVKAQIPLEEETTRDIKGWIEANLTSVVIERWKDENASDAENDLLVMAHIRASLIKQYPEQQIAYLEKITEEYYNESIIIDEEQ